MFKRKSHDESGWVKLTPELWVFKVLLSIKEFTQLSLHLEENLEAEDGKVCSDAPQCGVYEIQ